MAQHPALWLRLFCRKRCARMRNWGMRCRLGSQCSSLRGGDVVGRFVRTWMKKHRHILQRYEYIYIDSHPKKYRKVNLHCFKGDLLFYDQSKLFWVNYVVTSRRDRTECWGFGEKKLAVNFRLVKCYNLPVYIYIHRCGCICMDQTNKRWYLNWDMLLYVSIYIDDMVRCKPTQDWTNHDFPRNIIYNELIPRTSMKSMKWLHLFPHLDDGRIHGEMAEALNIGVDKWLNTLKHDGVDIFYLNSHLLPLFLGMNLLWVLKVG